MYLTVINEITNESVPFERIRNGEIKLLSVNPIDTEINCKVCLTKTFYEFSVDYNQFYSRN